MDNFFLRDLDLTELNKSIKNNQEINDMYFEKESKNKIVMEEKKEVIVGEYKLEELLNSFENESELAQHIKLTIMKKIKREGIETEKYKIFNYANNFFNKYFYQIKLFDSKV